MKSIRIIIVDDDLVWMEQVSKYLSYENDMNVVGMASSHNTAVELCRKLKPDLVLMDINLTGNIEDKSTGLTTALLLIKELNIKVIVLSSISEEEVIKNSFFTGALQYMQKKNIYDLKKCNQRLYGC